MITLTAIMVHQHILEMFLQSVELEVQVTQDGLAQTLVLMEAEQTDTLDKLTQKVFLLEAHIIQKLPQALEHKQAQLHLLADTMEAILVETMQAAAFMPIIEFMIAYAKTKVFYYKDQLNYICCFKNKKITSIQDYMDKIGG